MSEQYNLFGGTDKVLSDVESRFAKLNASPRRTITIKVTAEVPDGTDEEITNLLKYEFGASQALAGAMVGFNVNVKGLCYE